MTAALQVAEIEAYALRAIERAKRIYSAIDIARTEVLHGL